MRISGVSLYIDDSTSHLSTFSRLNGAIVSVLYYCEYNDTCKPLFQNHSSNVNKSTKDKMCTHINHPKYFNDDHHHEVC